MPRRAIMKSSPGHCKQICPCTRCDENGTPYAVTVDYDGTEYVLTKWEAESACAWRIGFVDYLEFGTGEEFQFLLALIETTEDFRWLLLVWDPDDEEVYQYSFTVCQFGDPEAPDYCETVPCTDAQTLTETTTGGAGTVDITPGEARSACCPCEDEEGSGSGGGGGEPENCCCETESATREYDVDLGAGGWTNNPSPPAPGDCGLCNTVGGVYTVAYNGHLFVPCWWVYFESGGAGCGSGLQINLIRQCNQVLGNYWFAWVDMDNGFLKARAVYQAPVDDDDCFVAAPLTLTKIAQVTGPNQYCGGTLPDTITIQSV